MVNIATSKGEMNGEHVILDRLYLLYRALKISGDLRSFFTIITLKDLNTRVDQKKITQFPIKKFTIKNASKKYPITLRNYSTDVSIFREIFFDQCYVLPSEFRSFSGVFFDIGANVGLSSVLLTMTWPEIKIYAFEPLQNNYDLLVENSAPSKKIIPLNLAISKKTGEEKFAVPLDNTSGGGFIDPRGILRVRCVSIEDFCRNEHITSLDLVKIDCEGCEYEILYGLNQNILKNIKIIVGELHGDRAIGLLNYLSQWFDIGVRKQYNLPHLTFTAANKKLEISEKWELAMIEVT
jgi:FkbM family methyltransferase